MSPQLGTGDVVFVKDKQSKVSFLIRFFSTRFGEEPTFANHVGLMNDEMWMCEAVAPRVKYVRLWEKYGKERFEVVVFRNKRVTADWQVRSRLRAAMAHYHDKKYGFGKIAAHAVDWFLSALTAHKVPIYAARWVARMDNYPICSWLVWHCYKRAEVPFECGQEAQPDDLWDECKASPEWRQTYPVTVADILKKKREKGNGQSS